MNEQIKTEWLKALRSGEYEQGHDELKQDNRYCCLGVLCDVVQKGWNGAKWEDEFIVSTDNPEDKEAGVLNQAVMICSGLFHAEPVVYYEKRVRKITGLNDSENLTFAQLADIIEAQL